MSDLLYDKQSQLASDGWQSWLGDPVAGLLAPDLRQLEPPATGLMHEVSPGANFLRNVATGAAGVLHGVGILATGVAAQGARLVGYEDALDPAFRYLDRFKDDVDQRYGPHADEHLSGWSKVAGLAGQAVPLLAGAALTGGAGDLAEGASLGMNALRMAAAAAPVSGASALSQTAGAVRNHDMSTAEAERMLAGKYGEQELMSMVPFSVGGKVALAAGLSGLRALPVKAVAGAVTQMAAGPAARAVGNLGLDETTREYEEPIAPGWEDLVLGAGFGMLHGGRGLDVPPRYGGGHTDPSPAESPPPIPPPPASYYAAPEIAPPQAGRFVSGDHERPRGLSLDSIDPGTRPESGMEVDSTLLPDSSVGNPRQNTSVYTVAYEFRLDPKDFGRRRRVHYNRANEAFHGALQGDSEFADMMDKIIPNVLSITSSVGGRKTPNGWIWEHASRSTAFGEEGVMRLVPAYQHTPGSAWWRALHPDPGAAGGYSEWAIPAGAPQNRR